MKNLQIIDLHRANFQRELENLKSNGEIIPLCEDTECITELEYLPACDHIWFVVPAPRNFTTAKWSMNCDLIAVCEDDRNVRCYRNSFYNPLVTLNVEDHVDDPIAAEVNMACIAWRENSEEFCIWFFDEIWKIRIYNIYAQLLENVIEIPGMLPCVAWRRSSLVCPTLNEDGIFFISMYEKNGLKLVEFPLDEEVITIGGIKWNEVSDIMLVNVVTSENSFVNVYTQTNFDHQLKQQFVTVPEDPLQLFNFMQCTEQMIEFYIATGTQITYHKLLLKPQNGILPNGLGFFAEVDSNKLKLKRIEGDYLTGPDDTIQIIQVAVPINIAVFHYAFDGLIIIDSCSNIFLYSFDDNSMKKIGERLLNEDAPHAFMPINIYNVCFTSDNSILFVYLNDLNSHDLCELNFVDFEIEIIDNEERINYMTYVLEYNQVLKRKANKVVYLNDHQHLSPIDHDMYEMKYVIVSGDFYMITLDVGHNLRINNNIICRSATSFILHARYLFITAFGCKLYSIQLTEENMHNLCNESLAKLNMFNRDIEDGSILLCGIPTKNHVLLYHPRGNTETVLCRNVAINQIRTYICRNKWKEAFELARIERLDFNLLVDINPTQFLWDVKNFVRAIDSPNLLQMFVLSLIDDNVLQSTYKYMNLPTVIPLSNKKKMISQAIFNAIKPDLVKYVKVMMLVAQSMGGIKSSVEVLYNFYTEYGDVENVLRDGLNCLVLYFPKDEVQSACFLKVDTGFIRCVFGKLNIDPNLYVSVLNEVDRNSSRIYRQFHIVHHHVENYKEALEYLVVNCMNLKLTVDQYDESDDVEEMIEYADSHEILTHLYKCCVKHNFFNTTIIKLYTDELKCNGRHEEAALILRTNMMWSEALDVLMHCGLWKEVIVILDRLGLDKREHLQSLATTLKSRGDHVEAANLYDQLSQPEQAITCLLSVKLFNEALQCAFKYSRNDLIEIIRQDYLNYYHTLMEKVENSCQSFRKHLRRLQAVRSIHAAASLEHDSTMAGTSGQDLAESVAGSLSTTSTRSTRSSLRQRRRNERIRHDLRQGGPYENIALMRTLHKIISESYSFCKDIKYFCEVVMAYEPHGYQMAKRLQDAQGSFLRKIEIDSNIIWPPDLNAVNIPETPELAVLRRNLDLLEMNYRYPPEPVPTNWKLVLLDEVVHSLSDEDF
ncbi:hypothetical protein Trydic_g13359 [Trypoxylus dichotomus]